MWPIGVSRCSQNYNSKAFCRLPMKILKEKEKKKKKKEKDNQYKLKKAMATPLA